MPLNDAVLDNGISSDGVRALSGALKYVPRLATLYLGSNGIRASVLIVRGCQKCLKLRIDATVCHSMCCEFRILRHEGLPLVFGGYST